MTKSNAFQRVIGIDTAGQTMAVGLLEGDAVRAEFVGEEQYEHSRRLAAVVAQLMREAGWQPDELDLIAVTAGPGSYTGLRLGAMAAKVLSWSTGVSIAGVDALAVLAANLPAGDGEKMTGVGPAGEKLVIAMLGARRGQVYSRGYEVGPGLTPQPITGLLEGNIADVADRLRQAVDAGRPLPVWLVGEGSRRYAAELESAFTGAAIHWSAPVHDKPRGTVVAHLGRQLALSGQTATALDFMPQYSSPSFVTLAERGTEADR